MRAARQSAGLDSYKPFSTLGEGGTSASAFAEPNGSKREHITISFIRRTAHRSERGAKTRRTKEHCQRRCVEVRLSLFISNLSDAAQATTDLFAIVRCDGGLGQASVPMNNQVAKVTYTKSVAGAGQDRIEALVAVATPVVISAATSGTTIPDGMGGTVPINLVGGATFPPDANGIIQVAYCFDNIMFAFDAGGAKISLPRSVILFHELAHAFHRANGTFNVANPESQAETDENAFRAQVGLTARDANNHNGGEGLSNGQSVPSCSGMSGCCGC